jgi:hypothetical protein
MLTQLMLVHSWMLPTHMALMACIHLVHLTVSNTPFMANVQAFQLPHIAFAQ